MFGNKRKNKPYVEKPEDHESIIESLTNGRPTKMQDIYTTPEDWMEDESVESITADEANEMAHKYVENKFEELKLIVNSSIKSEANSGRYKTHVNTSSEEVAIQVCEYLRMKGYDATYKSNSVYGQNHIAFNVLYTIDIGWSDSDER